MQLSFSLDDLKTCCMNDVITNALSRAEHKRTSLQVIKRYFKLKYRILISDEVLKSRLVALGQPVK